MIHPLPSLQKSLSIRSFRPFGYALLALFAIASVSWSETIWRIGLADDSSAEFGLEGQPPADYPIPEDWQTRTVWPDFAPGTSGRPPVGKWWKTRIPYALEEVPEHGVEFTFKTVDASGMVPEVAVFSNGFLAGILQIVGAETPNEGNPRKFGQTHRVYIPKAFLQSGENELRLEKLPPIYNRGSGNRIYLDIEFDYFALDALSEAPASPTHSRHVHMGSVYGSFQVDAARAENVGKTWEWLGVAYSGNPLRASFWSNIPGQTHYRETLETAAAYNMSPILTYLTDKNSADRPGDWIDPETGDLLPDLKAKLDRAWRNWGDLIQYYELSNEPCMSITNASFKVNMALARYIAATKPEHVKLLGPGYAFGGGHGDPKNWSSDAEYRRKLAVYCDAAGGHAYGRSYYKQPGGIINETIDTYGEGDPPVIRNGFTKELIVTEMGSHLTSHYDFTNLGIGSTRSRKLRASVYDKIMRAHVGFADRFLNFSSFGSQDAPFRMLDGNRGKPETWRAAPFPEKGKKFPNEEVDTKLGIFRRIALAYATHGRPLSYAYFNKDEVKNQLVYFRAVDTSTLPPLPGSGATSDKILLNFVNFSDQPQTMELRVNLPEAGVYRATRFGPEPAYADARREGEFEALPHLDLSENLGPYEAVQYILTPPETTADY